METKQKLKCKLRQSTGNGTVPTVRFSTRDTSFCTWCLCAAVLMRLATTTRTRLWSKGSRIYAFICGEVYDSLFRPLILSRRSTSMQLLHKTGIINCELVTIIGFLSGSDHGINCWTGCSIPIPIDKFCSGSTKLQNGGAIFYWLTKKRWSVSCEVMCAGQSV